MAGYASSQTAVGRGSPTASHLPRCLGTRQEPKYWQEHHWRLEGDVLYGYYRTFRGSYEGAIKLFPSGIHKYFIIRPPNEIAMHSHSQCFVYQGRDHLYWIHFNLEPKNVDAGIMTVETILREALELTSGRTT